MFSAVLEKHYNTRLMLNLKTKIQFYCMQEIEKMGPKSKQTKNGGLFVFLKKIDVNFDPFFFISFGHQIFYFLI